MVKWLLYGYSLPSATGQHHEEKDVVSLVNLERAKHTSMHVIKPDERYFELTSIQGGMGRTNNKYM